MLCGFRNFLTTHVYLTCIYAISVLVAAATCALLLLPFDSVPAVLTFGRPLIILDFLAANRIAIHPVILYREQVVFANDMCQIFVETDITLSLTSSRQFGVEIKGNSCFCRSFRQKPFSKQPPAIKYGGMNRNSVRN